MSERTRRTAAPGGDRSWWIVVSVGCVGVRAVDVVELTICTSRGTTPALVDVAHRAEGQLIVGGLHAQAVVWPRAHSP